MFIFVLSVQPGFAQPASSGKITWKLWTPATSTHAYVSNVYRPFVEEVKQKTNGQLEITIYTAGELPYKGTEILSAVKNREVEIGEAISNFVTSEFPMMRLWSAPFMNTSMAEHKAMREVLLAETETALNKQFKAHWLFNGCYPSTQLFSNKSIKSLADLKGMRIRTVGPEDAEVLGALGSTGVAMTTPDVYTALQRGTVDGTSSSYMSCYSNKWFEVAKHGLEWNNTISPTFMAVNLDALNALPKEVRKTLEEVARKYQDLWYESAVNLDAKFKKDMVALGATFVPISEQDKKKVLDIVQPLKGKWMQRVPGGDALLQKVLKVTSQ
jgi:TRAP-type C4-dicarboxylate transport system substrate-binding protein